MVCNDSMDSPPLTAPMYIKSQLCDEVQAFGADIAGKLALAGRWTVRTPVRADSPGAMLLGAAKPRALGRQPPEKGAASDGDELAMPSVPWLGPDYYWSRQPPLPPHAGWHGDAQSGLLGPGPTPANPGLKPPPGCWFWPPGAGSAPGTPQGGGTAESPAARRQPPARRSQQQPHSPSPPQSPPPLDEGAGRAAAQEASAGAPAPPPGLPLPGSDGVLAGRPTLTRGCGGGGGECDWVEWCVDAKKLAGADKQAVSPSFPIDVPDLGPTPFRLAIYPIAKSDGKGAGGFRKAKGRGRVELKCEAQLPQGVRLRMSFTIGIGSGAKQQPSRGFVSHDFAEQSCRGLDKLEEEWDFSLAVDEASKTFAVRLLVAPVPRKEEDPGQAGADSA